MLTALIVGLDPALLTDPTADVNAARVRTNMDDAVDSLAVDGIEAELFLLRGPTEATVKALAEVVERRQPDAVMIGAGVRLEPSLSWFLELMVNRVNHAAPRTKLCFNEDPESMADAVRRVLEGSSSS